MNNNVTLGLALVGFALFLGYRFTRPSAGGSAPSTSPDGAGEEDEGDLAPADAGIVGVAGLRNAKTQPMQAGLPRETQAVWTDLQTVFGDRIVILGAWGDRSHQARVSAHNTGRAIDATVQRGKTRTATEKATGDAIAARYIGGRLGVTQIIWDGRIATKARGWTWRPYNGPNPHTHHVHLSVNYP